MKTRRFIRNACLISKKPPAGGAKGWGMRHLNEKDYFLGWAMKASSKVFQRALVRGTASCL